MYLLIFLAVSLILAIPTFGLSLLVFFVVKNWFDNRAMSSLLGAAVTAMRTKVSQERYHINRAAIRKVFSRFSGSPAEVHCMGSGGATLYWGLVQHPMINDNQVFSVRISYIPRMGTSNAVFVKAAPGHDQDVLSADDLYAFLSNPIIRNETAENISFLRPKSDTEIKYLIVKLASSNRSDCKYPKFRYGDIGDFAFKHSGGVDCFENYRGMRFWVNIGESSYAIYVENLDPSKEDDGGVSISAKLDGPAEQIVTADV